MTHKSGVDGSTSRLARVLFTENSIIFSSCNIFQIEFCRRGSDRRGPWFCFSKESIRATHTPRTVIVQDVQSPLRPQQRFDRTALVHRAIALRHLIQAVSGRILFLDCSSPSRPSRSALGGNGALAPDHRGGGRERKPVPHRSVPLRAARRRTPHGRLYA